MFSLLLLSPLVVSLKSSPSPLPALGWNSWNNFACSINESLIKQTADLLVSTGLRDAGYKYVNIDDCWAEKERDVRGFLQHNKTAFPSGMKALGDYIHERGLLFGIYSDRGPTTCAGYPGSRGFEDKDALTWAEWGVDYLKYDNCYTNPFFNTAQEDYSTMGQALKKTGRPIYYSICTWGQDEPWMWAPYVGDSWRISGDIGDLWRINKFQEWYDCPCTTNWCPKIVVSGGHNCSILNIMRKVEMLTQYTSLLGSNDMDMLEVGRGGMSKEEYETHFAFWAALKSPLLIGADLSTISPTALALLKNKELLAINQDPLRDSIRIVKKEQGKYQVWTGRLKDGSAVFLVMNELDSAQEITWSFSSLGLGSHQQVGIYRIKDIWTFADHLVPDTMSSTIPTHGTLVFKILSTAAIKAANSTLSPPSTTGTFTYTYASMPSLASV